MHPHDLHISHSEEHQLSLPVTVSSSGDDHLLTARADDEHFKVLDFGQCHDNRAFQYHNNNKMLPRPGGSGKSKDDSSMAAALEVVIVHSPASNEQRLIGAPDLSANCCRRKRNNATQTRLEGGSCCCVITTHHHHCHCNHHRHHHHHHHHHSHSHSHCNYRSTKRRALLHQKRHEKSSQQNHHHGQRDTKQTNHNQMLPNKSSLDSSEDGLPPHHQAIAIEIDAATMSEDGEDNNSSTATSNFPYKVASEGMKPIIMAPLREQHHHRRSSLNSNTTIETDELSHDEDDDDVRMGSQQLPEDETHLTQPPNTNSSSSSTKRGAPASAPARNECVRIKRKRFIADAGQDYCSSCSSSCSCSSLDEDHHEMTVAAECHQCVSGSRRASYCSCHNSSCCCGSCSQDEAGDDEEEADDEDDETTGQRESFCTAADHTITPSQEGDDMHSSTLTPLSTHRSSFVDQELGDHTMRSDNIGGGNLTDADASSLSQSAEYFSLSSTAGGNTSFPIQDEKKSDKKDKELKEVEQPSCKNFNRNPHTKHKRSSSPVDSSL
ncbi:hypothetical protein KR067_013181 [Drosophila pandora]|nr:hypothetical protein KR067_013181 [Drosophila pandora]